MTWNSWFVWMLMLILPLLLLGCPEDTEVEGDEAGECSDGVDNDQDGRADCDDPGCNAATACEGDDDDTSDDDDTTPGDDDDDDTSDDDDTTPGDDDDDDTQGDDDDDDTSDDDDTTQGDDDDATPPTWTQAFEYRFMSDGAGSAGFTMTHTVYDNGNLQCTVELGGNSSIDTGPGQGQDYYAFIDELILWATAPGEVSENSNDCAAAGVTPYQGDIASGYQGTAWPLGVISCDYIGSEATLNTLFVGDDVFFGLGDGTLVSYCDTVGPFVELQYITGAVEGVWLAPGPEGAIDYLGTFDYLMPADTSTYPSYMIKGLLMADIGNNYEPGPYMGEDDYVTISFYETAFTP